MLHTASGGFAFVRPAMIEKKAATHRLAEKRYAPATERNREPILGVLRSVLPDHGSVLEIAAGTGEHAVFFASALPNIIWQPTDIEAANLRSIEAWAAGSNLSNLKPACYLDVNEWPESEDLISAFDAIVCINMIHIAPWMACRGLMAGAATRCAVLGCFSSMALSKWMDSIPPHPMQPLMPISRRSIQRLASVISIRFPPRRWQMVSCWNERSTCRPTT